jgi:hypothetical protein
LSIAQFEPRWANAG